MTEEELSELETLCAATTAGLWKSYVEGRDHVSGSSFIMTAEQDIELFGATIADQDFIARAHQDVPRLLNEVRRLRTAAPRL